jgi:hypothetical protein
VVTEKDIVRIRGQLGAAIRHGQVKQVEQFRQDLAVANIEMAVARFLREVPILSTDRANHLCEVVQQFAHTPADALTA